MGWQAYLVYYPFLLLAAGNCLVAMLVPRFRRFTTIVSLVIILFFVISVFWINYPNGYDFSIFREAGSALQRGENPYSDPRFVSPPTSLPLFFLFSLLEFPAALFAWTLLNAVMALAITSLSWHLLTGNRRPADLIECLPLTALFVLAIPTFWGLNLGQVALFQAFVLVVALASRDNRMPFWAGAGLALATIKPQTALPFLIPFAHLRYYRVAIVTALCIVAMILSTRPVGGLFHDIDMNLKNIAALSRPGEINDYSFASHYNYTLISPNYLLYCLGMRDEGVIQILSAASLLLAGVALWLAWISKRLAQEAVMALTACYALLFLYHRISDATLLIVPFTYLYLEIRQAEGLRRRLLVGAFLCLLSIWLIHAKGVSVAVAHLSSSLPAFRYLGEALLLPYATWAILVSAGLMLAALRARSGRESDRSTERRQAMAPVADATGSQQG